MGKIENYSVIINEFLPNPAGKDADGEFIELFNNEATAVNLAGWKLKDASGKTFTIKSANLEPFGYLVLDYKTTKITLNNSDESLLFFDSAGNLIDKMEFAGSAKSGQSLIKQDGNFVFTEVPTPGRPNIFKLTEKTKSSSNSNYSKSAGEPISVIAPKENLSANISRGDFPNILIGVFVSVVLAGVFMLVYKKLNTKSASTSGST